MSHQTSPADPIFGMRELGGLLWAHRWLLLVSALAGLGWGLIAYPPGQQVVQSEIFVAVSPPPPVQSMQDLDLWHVLAVTAGFDPEGTVGRGLNVSARPATGGINIGLESSGNDIAPHDAALARLQADLKPASDAVMTMVQKRLEVLRTIEVTAAAQYLVVQEAFVLQMYLDTVKIRTDGVFNLEKRSVQVRPRSGPDTYIRFVLIALAAGIAVTILLHLLRLLWRGRSEAARA